MDWPQVELLLLVLETFPVVPLPGLLVEVPDIKIRGYLQGLESN